MSEPRLSDIEKTNNYLKATKGRGVFIAFFDDRIRASGEDALQLMADHVGAEMVRDITTAAKTAGVTLSAFRVPSRLSDEWPFSALPAVAYCPDGEHEWVEDPIIQDQHDVVVMGENGKPDTIKKSDGSRVTKKERIKKPLSETRHPGWTCRRCRMHHAPVLNPTESERRVVGDVKPTKRGALCKPFCDR